MNPATLPTPQQTMDSMQELLRMDAVRKAAEARGGNPPEIAALLSAASGDAPAVVVHGWKLHLPSFGGLQVLDEIQSPVVIGGPVSFGQIAAVMVVLENQETAWQLLSKPDGLDRWNRHVWERTRNLSVTVANDVGRAAMRLVRTAVGLGTEEDEPGNGAEGTPAPSAAAPVLTPDGSPASSSALSTTTDSPSIMLSGVSPLNAPDSSSMPATNAPATNLQAPVPQTAPASPPSAPPAAMPAPAPAPAVRRFKVCGVDCQPGQDGCNGYCHGTAPLPPFED